LAELQQSQENQRQLEEGVPATNGDVTQAHVARLQQRQEQRQLEGQQHEAYLAKLQQSQENQRQLEGQQHEAHLAELQQRQQNQRQLETQLYEAHLAEL
jgi:hypothetical protein